jgi:phosphatidylserine/phosphatidylglycerophosphate/cardiolipin synthase-like enzyme
MRAVNSDNGISVRAIAGTYVVLLGIDMSQGDTKGLLGFAIKRTDHTENEEYWLQGMRVFEAMAQNAPDGMLTSSYENPIQDFLWSDFTAKPAHKYTYEVVPVSGQPKNLQYGASVKVDVETEGEEEGTHSVYFNRGVIAAQAYARKWKAAPDKLEGADQEAALTWLSRGLFEAMVAFIGQASGKKYGLRAAVYEFDYEPAIKAFADAAKKSGDVKIVYDARTGSAQQKKRVANVKKLLKKYGLTEDTIPRTSDPRLIAHNKFIILLEDDEPVSVWTGSTNYTESGIYGQSNVGHVVRDKDIAAAYLAYWTNLSKDPAVKDLRAENDEQTPTLTVVPPAKGTTPIFSPRTGTDQLAWYAKAMGAATGSVCFTAAFGVNKVYLDVFKVKKDFLRYLFLEKWGVNAKLAAQAQKDLHVDRNVQAAVGTILGAEDLLRWVKEQANTLSTNVRYVHTKYMLVDPLGDDPIVVSGSANFSDASTTSNDENMLVIRGDTRVADIYLGEFMRLWRFYNFRDIVQKISKDTGKPVSNWLAPDDSWTKKYFTSGTIQELRRKTFAPS